MKLERPDPRIGAIATEVDVRALSDADWNALYRAWLDGIVLVVRGQTLTMEEFLAYSRRFGRLKPHRVRKTRHPDHPELTLMGVGTRKPDGQVDQAIYNRGGGWHTDSPWDTEICKGTQLYGIAIPSRGGDTLFASMYEAYDVAARKPEEAPRRPEGRARLWRPRAQGQRSAGARRPAAAAGGASRRAHPRGDRPQVALCQSNPHPAHPGAGRFRERQLIAELTDHMVATPAQYRHKWQKGDIVIWDNRCALHSATGGYPIEEPRIHWRVTIMQEATEAQRAA